MKSRGFDLSIGRTTLTVFSVVKLSILSSILMLFLNVTLSLYSTVSTHYYFSIKQPIYKFSSSFDTLQGSSSSSPLPTNPSQSPPPKLDQSDISSPLPSTFSSLNSMDSPLLSAFNNLDSSPVQYKSSSSSSSSIQNPSASSPNDYSNSSIAINQNTVRPIVRNKLLPKGCDLSKGEWVEDPNAPYYTNSTCWMIQEHQNCIKYGRPDLDFLKWRWKPDGCELPLLDPTQFLELMRGKVLAFIGDSLARNQMQSLMCLLSRVAYPKEISSSDESPTRMFYQSHNLTVWFFWSPFLIRAEQSNHTVRGLPSWNLYLDEPDPLWPALLPSSHFAVLSTGDWYARPCLFHLHRALAGCHRCPIPAPFMSTRRAHRRAFRTALDSILAAKRRGFEGVAVVRTVSPSHSETGEWNRGGDCRPAKAFGGKGAAPRLQGLEKEMYEEQVKEFWRAKWEGREEGLDLRLLDGTKAMAMRGDGHPGEYGRSADEISATRNDCVHWCLPGPVDMWNDFLFQVIAI